VRQTGLLVLPVADRGTVILVRARPRLFPPKDLGAELDVRSLPALVDNAGAWISRSILGSV